ncbi:MAG: hypothetical protein IJ619_08770 [Eubacterium sp.]|nr:hypothetical protein [Eubacterium sp.]
MSGKNNEIIRFELKNDYGIQLNEQTFISDDKKDDLIHINIGESNIESEIETIRTLVQSAYNIDTLSNSWSVTMNGLAVLPEQLMQKNNGAYMINLKTVSNGFGKTVDLKPMGEEVPVATNVAGMVWALGSYVFQKHYLKNIDQKLESLQSSVEEIKSFLEEDKQAEIESDLKRVNEIAIGYQDIISNPKELQMRLNQLGIIERKAEKNVRFFGNRLDKKINKYTSKHKRKNDKALIDDLKYDWKFYNACMRLNILTKLLIELLSKDMNLEILDILEGILEKEMEQYLEKYNILQEHLYEYHNKKFLNRVDRGLSWTLDKSKTGLGKAVNILTLNPLAIVNDDTLEMWSNNMKDKAKSRASNSVTNIIEIGEDEMIEPFSNMIGEMRRFYCERVNIICNEGIIYLEIADNQVPEERTIND